MEAGSLFLLPRHIDADTGGWGRPSHCLRRTSLSRNTIKTWLREPVRSEMTYQRPGGPCKLDAHADWFVQALEADAWRPRKERRTALRLLAQLREQGYAGGYSQVTAFIRSWRAKTGAVTARSGYVPLRFDNMKTAVDRVPGRGMHIPVKRSQHSG